MRSSSHLDSDTLSHTLAVLGFKRLDRFLDSPEWRKLESRILSERPRCQHCRRSQSRKVLLGGADLLTLSGCRDERLTAVCGNCFTLATYRVSEPRTPWDRRNLNKFIPADRIRELEHSRGPTSFDRLCRQERSDSAARQERRRFRAKRVAKRQRRLERRKKRRAAAGTTGGAE
jgi:hypothetical protein